jgi:hypothetical protein
MFAIFQFKYVELVMYVTYIIVYTIGICYRKNVKIYVSRETDLPDSFYTVCCIVCNIYTVCHLDACYCDRLEVNVIQILFTVHCTVGAICHTCHIIMPDLRQMYTYIISAVYVADNCECDEIFTYIPYRS